jgi:type II secretory pathway component PulM
MQQHPWGAIIMTEMSSLADNNSPASTSKRHGRRRFVLAGMGLVFLLICSVPYCKIHWHPLEEGEREMIEKRKLKGR